MPRYNTEMDPGASISFIGYQIINTGDGLVLKTEDGKGWQGHLGNYGTIADAKCGAVIYYMIARPEKFHAVLFYHFIGTGMMHEYYALRNSLKEEGFEVPEEVTLIDALNGSIGFNGKHIGEHFRPSNVPKQPPVACNEHKALEAIKARLAGEWDNPHLVEFGQLHRQWEDDIEPILQHYGIIDDPDA